MKARRVGLIFDRPYIDAHYCFREMAVQFSQNGWHVDLYMTKSAEHPVPVFDSHRIRVHFIDRSKAGLPLFLAKLVMTRYDAMVATPQWALYWAVRVGQMSKTPVVCLSDEVYPRQSREYDLRSISVGEYARWKKREAWAHRHCALTVALGQERFELAKRENGLSADHAYVIVPNAPAAESRARIKSSYYRDLLKVPADRTVLLHSGGLGWRLLKPLAASLALSPEPVVVALQNRFRGDKPNWLNENVKLASEVLESRRMREATSSADIGLMLYDQAHAEERRNGATAGKLGLYLSCGLPVICCNLEALQWVEKEGCGVWVNDVALIPEAAKKIMADYGRYSQNALRVFDESYEYGRHFNIFLEKLNEIIGSGPTQTKSGAIKKIKDLATHRLWLICEKPFLDQYPRALESALTGCKTLLDVGCGTNSPLKRISFKVERSVGVDIFQDSLRQSKESGIHDEYVLADIQKLSEHFMPKSFDVVLCTDVLEHLEKPAGRQLLGAMEKIARKKVIVFTPNGYFPQGEQDGNVYQKHLSGWTADEMRQHGFQSVLGLRGWRPLGAKYPKALSRPHLFWRGLSSWTQGLVLRHPEQAFQLLCIKELGDV